MDIIISAGIGEQVVACCCMVNVSPIEALDEELSGEPKVFTNQKGLLVNVLCRKVFGDAAVVGVAEFDLVILVIEQIVHVYIVHIALNVFEVNVRLLVATPSDGVVIVFIVFFLLRLVIVCFFQPLVR